ncbi:MAG TPA: hypothetical protein VGH09_02620 [Solirubrobacteraceae bacterium]|jgi:hypothetical protein
MFRLRRGFTIGAAIAVASVTGCGKTGARLSYEQRIHKLEALLARCGNEPADAGYRRCLSQDEDTVRSYVEHLCPHPGGYTFEGQHESCPSHPIKQLLTIR